MASTADGQDEAQKAEDIEFNQMVEFLKKFPKGTTDDDIKIELPDLSSEQRVKIINKLLTHGCLDLFNSGGKIVYRYKESTKGLAKGTDNEEKVVYSIIEEAGNKGIWIRDIRLQSNLIPTQLNKILKALEGKKLIKAVKSVSASKKKVYMLYNLEPDKSLTGGAWYSDQDFEAEFVDVLSQQCLRYLQQRQEGAKGSSGGPQDIINMCYASSRDVWKFITEIGISKVPLSVEDIETILETTVYDGKVEKSLLPDRSKRYRVIESLLPPTGLVRNPCGVCPVFKFCSSTGSVTSKKCVYLNDWLQP